MGSFMKYASIALVFMGLLLLGCDQPENVKIQIKQIIPLPTGTIIEISAPLDINQSSFDSIIPRTGENQIFENTSFVIPIEIENVAAHDYKNTKIILSYGAAEYIRTLYPFSTSKEPLQLIGNDTYVFDNDLKASQKTILLLAGNVGLLPPNMKDGGIEINISIVDDNNTIITSKADLIRIVRG